MKSREENKFTEWVQRYHDSLFQFVLKRVNDETEAQDLLQEIYTKAFNHFDSFNPRYAFSTWIFTIAENTCIDHFRRKKRQQKKQEKWALAHPAEEKEDAHKRLLLPNAAELAASLPEKYRAVFVLRYTEGMKYKDIAQKTGIPMGTVKTYLFRAKAALSTSHQKRNREDA